MARALFQIWFADFDPVRHRPRPEAAEPVERGVECGGGSIMNSISTTSASGTTTITTMMMTIPF